MKFIWHKDHEKSDPGHFHIYPGLSNPILNEQGKPVLDLLVYPDNKEEAQEVLRLVLAAPDLFADLKVCLMHLESCPTNTAKALVAIISKSIAKVEDK